MTAPEAVIQAAVAQVGQGFAAFALAVNGKRPVTDHGFKNATRRPEWVRTQLLAPSAGNYGIVWPEDADDRVVVFDLDNGEAGTERPWQDRLRERIDAIGPLPSTKSTTTPSGGRHVFYRWPRTVPIPPGDELFGFTVRWPGRGYLVGPGSSIDGVPYTPGPNEAIADLPPAWVYAAIAERTPPAGTAATNGFAVISGGFVLPDRIPSGRRYATVRDYVASRYNAGLGPDELWDLVRSQVAPRFETAKPEAALRGDFERVMAKIVERLGPPARGIDPTAAVAAVSPIEIRNLADIAVEAVVWLWHRYLPVGSVTLFDGNPGEGKSTVVADLIARLTVGGEWPDGTGVGPAGDVLYITKEDDPATQVRPRIEAAGGDARRVNVVATDLLFPRDLPRFRELLAATRPRLVLLDPLMSYLEGRVKVISDNEVRSALMTPLAETARASGCAILVIRHFNKGSGQAALMRGAGSLGGLAGAARMVLALAGDPESDDDRARVFGVVKSNYEARPPSLRALIESSPVEGFQMTVSRASWHGTSATAVADLMERTREEHQQVLDAEVSLREVLEGSLGAMPSSDVHEAMKRRGHSRNAVYNAAKAVGVVVDRSGFPARSLWSLSAVTLQSSPKETTGTTAVVPVVSDGDDWDVARAGTQERPLGKTGMTGITGTTGESSRPVVPVVLAPPAPAGAREDEPAAETGATPELTVIREAPPVPIAWCSQIDDHRFNHRDVLTGTPWCEICSPREKP